MIDTLSKIVTIVSKTVNRVTLYYTEQHRFLISDCCTYSIDEGNLILKRKQPLPVLVRIFSWTIRKRTSQNVTSKLARNSSLKVASLNRNQRIHRAIFIRSILLRDTINRHAFPKRIRTSVPAHPSVHSVRFRCRIIFQWWESVDEYFIIGEITRLLSKTYGK